MAKGILLAGGLGTRLKPLTRDDNKHLLSVYTKRMVEIPLKTLTNIGLKDVVIVVGGKRRGAFLELLGNGHSYGVDRLYYATQEGEAGLPDALRQAQPFISKEHYLADTKEPCVVILGDNYFEEDLKPLYDDWINKGAKGACCILKQVEEPWHFGVAEVDRSTGKIISFEEKPAQPKSDLAVIGCYFFDAEVWGYINQISPSGRGELEITDILKIYLNNNSLCYYQYQGYWRDMGTFKSWMEVSKRLEELDHGNKE